MEESQPQLALSDRNEILSTCTIDLGQVRFAKDAIVAFASEFDPQPFHVDDEAARSTLLEGLAASGWHTCAMVMKRLDNAVAQKALTLQPAGAESIIWARPVRPDDVLECRATFAQALPCRCGDKARRVIVEAFNQKDEIAMRCHLDCIVSEVRSSRNAGEGNCTLKRGRPARVKRLPVSHALRHFDDVSPGEEIALGEYAFTSERVAKFGAHLGANEAHGAADLGTGNPIAPEVRPWHLTAAWMQRMVVYYEQEGDRLRSMGRPVPTLGPAAGVKHLRWHRPVHVGETITFRGWAERKIEIATKSGWGMLIVGAEGLDADGDTVVSFYPQMLLERTAEAC